MPDVQLAEGGQDRINPSSYNMVTVQIRIEAYVERVKHDESFVKRCIGWARRCIVEIDV
jgi:hypothetical protein